MIIKYNNCLLTKISRIRYDCIFNYWHFTTKSVQILYIGIGGCDINVYNKNSTSKLFSITYSDRDPDVNSLRITDLKFPIYEDKQNCLKGFNDLRNTIKSTLLKC